MVFKSFSFPFLFLPVPLLKESTNNLIRSIKQLADKRNESLDICIWYGISGHSTKNRTTENKKISTNTKTDQ